MKEKLNWVAAAIIVLSGASVGAADKPNIVFIMTDNLGYGDIGAYGGGELRNAPTPRIDRLAAEGLRLTNFNVEPECTPSRSAFMTGRLPIRSGTSRVPLPGLPQGIVPWEYTLAELLSDTGYSTALFGKWHLGDKQGRYPNDQGFDEWWGFAHSSGETLNTVQPGFSRDVGYVPKIEQGRRGEATVAVSDYDFARRPLIDEEITTKSADYIRAHAKQDKPFFLFVSYSLPHAPPIPNPKFRNPARTDYQNVLTEIDHNTGVVLDAIAQAGIEKDTVVVWVSDNGPCTYLGPNIMYGAGGDSGPFRGEIPSGWEGGIRVPGIIRWPGQIPPGRVSNEIVSMLDFYRTFARFAGAADKVPTDRPIDSIDQTDFFLGKQEKSARDHVMIFHGSELLAIKWRNFKAHFSIWETARGDVRWPGQNAVTSNEATPNVPLLFDVDNDPKELWNIGVANTWVFGALGQHLVKYEASVKKHANLTPGAEGPK
jgi:arylsulfatase